MVRSVCALGLGLVCLLSLSPAAEEPAVTVQVVTAKDFQQAVAKHRGKVVLVDCWATWCVPCIKDFPKTVALSSKYADQGLVVISLNFDDPVEGQPSKRVREFLQKQKAGFQNFVSAHDLSEDGADAFDIAGGALPNIKLYGRDGKLEKVFVSGDDEHTFTHDDVEQAVTTALKVKPKP